MSGHGTGLTVIGAEYESGVYFSLSPGIGIGLVIYIKIIVYIVITQSGDFNGQRIHVAVLDSDLISDLNIENRGEVAVYYSLPFLRVGKMTVIVMQIYDCLLYTSRCV